jgi:hypothetical protein
MGFASLYKTPDVGFAKRDGRTLSELQLIACRANQFDFTNFALFAGVQRIGNRVRSETNFTSRFNVIWVVQIERKK